VREFSDEWLENADAGKVLSKNRRPYTPSALRSIRHNLGRFVYPRIGGMKMAELRRRDVQVRLVDELIADGLGGQTIRNVVNALAAVCRYAIRRNLIVVNPTHDLELPERGGQRNWSRTPPEARRLIDALNSSDRALWGTALYAGLRRGELRALRVSDLHGLVDEVGELWISVERGWDDKEGPTIGPKSQAGIRRTLVPETLRVLLAAHIRATGRSGDELVFGRTATEPFTPTRVGDFADAAWAKAGLQRVTLHECRHGFKTFMDAAGVSESRADRYAGHSSSDVGDRYRHQLAGQLRDDALLLDEYLNREPAEIVELRTGSQTGSQTRRTASVSQAG
jgi:integrase